MILISGTRNSWPKNITFIQDIFDLRRVQPTSFKKYDFQIYDDIRKMIADIRQRDKEMELCRVVSGYAWPWASKKNPNMYDIEINEVKLCWNSVNQNWVNSNNAINEVGCIHRVQGYDLNYAGVILGPEITYDSNHNKFEMHSEKYFDMNGRRGIDDPKELERYIINIYKTLLTRGIEGTYVYIVDDNLRNFFKGGLS